VETYSIVPERIELAIVAEDEALVPYMHRSKL
jgi:hypothetical protein